MRIALALFSLLAVSHAIDPIFGCSSEVATTLLTLVSETAGGTIIATMMLLVVICALLYMFGIGLNRPEMTLLAKDEFFHLGISLGILLFFGTAMATGCALVQTSFDFAYVELGMGSQGASDQDTCRNDESISTVQELSSCYFDMMKDDADDLVNDYVQDGVELQLEASGMISYQGLSGGTTFAPEAYKRTWAMFMENMDTMFVIPAYVSISAQSLFINFFLGAPAEGSASTPALMAYLLPAAFVLRFIPITRQIGNLLIAFSVGVYLILPLFLALNGAMYAYVFTKEQCETYISIVDDPILGDCESDHNLLMVARLYPQAFLLPNLTIAIFITFISSINKALKVLQP